MNVAAMLTIATCCAYGSLGSASIVMRAHRLFHSSVVHATMSIIPHLITLSYGFLVPSVFDT